MSPDLGHLKEIGDRFDWLKKRGRRLYGVVVPIQVFHEIHRYLFSNQAIGPWIELFTSDEEKIMVFASNRLDWTWLDEHDTVVQNLSFAVRLVKDTSSDQAQLSSPSKSDRDDWTRQ